MKKWMRKIAMVVAICFGLLQPCTALATYYAYDESDIPWAGYEYVDYNGDGTAAELHYWYDDAYGNTADYYYYYDASTGYLYESMSYTIWGQDGYWIGATSSYDDYYYESVYDYYSQYYFEGQYYYTNSGSTFTELYFESLATNYYAYSYYAYNSLTGAYEQEGYDRVQTEYEDYYYEYWVLYDPGAGSYEYKVLYDDYYNASGYSDNYWTNLYTGAYEWSYDYYYPSDYHGSYYEYWTPDSGWGGYDFHESTYFYEFVTTVSYDYNIYSGAYYYTASVYSDDYTYFANQYYNLYEVYSEVEYQENFGNYYGYSEVYSSTPSNLSITNEEWNTDYYDYYHYYADSSGYYYIEDYYYEDLDHDSWDESGTYYEEEYNPEDGGFYYVYEFWDPSLGYGYGVSYWTEPSGSYEYEEVVYTVYDFGGDGGLFYGYWYSSYSSYDTDSGWSGSGYSIRVNGALYGYAGYYDYAYEYYSNAFTGAYSESVELWYYDMYHEYSEVWYDLSSLGYYYEYDETADWGVYTWTELVYSYADGYYTLESYYSYEYNEFYQFLNNASGRWNGYAVLYDWYYYDEYVWSISNGYWYLIAYFDDIYL